MKSRDSWGRLSIGSFYHLRMLQNLWNSIIILSNTHSIQVNFFAYKDVDTQNEMRNKFNRFEFKAFRQTNYTKPNLSQDTVISSVRHPCPNHQKKILN
jgi:uncharacterized protein YerC